MSQHITAPNNAPSARLRRWRRTANTFDVEDTEGHTLRLDILTPTLVRVRYAADGRFPLVFPIRQGFVRDDWPPCDVAVHEDEHAVYLTTSAWTVRVQRRTLCVDWLAPDGTAITGQAAPPAQAAGRGPVLRHTLAGDEHVYGFGFQRQALDVRGHKLLWARRFRHPGATAPFFMSTRGYGFYSNNTWEHTFDFTDTANGVYTVSADGGALDYYVMYGPSLREILRRYTELTGRASLPPRWALGLLYICRYFETQEAALGIARRFRSEDIPCDMMGLEPGWEDYPYSMTWRWSPQRFPDPAGFVGELARMGYALEMWESGAAPKTDYADPEVRRAWYRQRLATSVDLGVRFFKQDDPFPRGIISEEMQAPQLGEPLGESGDLCKEEMYNVSNSLYSETAFNEYRRATGQRALYIFNGYNSSIASQRWPVAWAADFLAGCGMLSAGMSGHSMVAFDMRNRTLAGVHLGFLTPFAIMDAWAYYIEPWLLPDHLQASHRLYAKLRHCLSPYLYSTLWQAQHSSAPMMRAMALDYGHDAEARDLTTQYMLGDWLLCGLQPRVYLPRGVWIDYWTGETYASAGQWLDMDVPEPAGGPLLVKAGAIIPLKPIAAYIEQEPAHLIVLDIYPDDKASTFELYEDDGRTYAYEDGVHATTQITCRRQGDDVHITIGARQGSYGGEPDGRAYLLCVHTPGAHSVQCDGDDLPHCAAGRDSLLCDGDARGWAADADGLSWIKLDAGWRLQSDARGAADPEQDTLAWIGTARPALSARQIVVHAPATRSSAAVTHAPRPYPLSPTPFLGVHAAPDRLHVVANPPERIALKWDEWPAYVANFYVSVCAGEARALSATNVVRMEVLDAAGSLLHAEEKPAQRGRVEFIDVAYKPGEWTFRFSSDGLQPCSVQIRPAPAIVGHTRAPGET